MGNGQGNADSMYNEGTWTIAQNPNAVHDQWINLPSNTNNMLMLNGATLPAGGQAATWTSNSFAVTAGEYNYSYDLMNLCCNTYSGTTSVLQFWYTDGLGNQTLISPIVSETPAAPGVFVTEIGQFNVVANGSIRVGLIDEGGEASGNDFGVDNISVSTGFVNVPEPASWALMLVGFGGLGSVLRGQRRRQAVAA
ncbi:MAG: PEP-CTERM sorting domain-containing protein [Phenylobacterium sp.]|nr:MAG: PEP-CTERM sorting domain-containing protein [Phenylobacterium sp.]